MGLLNVKNLIDLKPDLIANNSSILKRAVQESALETTGRAKVLKGEVNNGHSKFFVTAAEASSVNITFTATLPSIRATEFESFRIVVSRLLGETTSAKLDALSGIDSDAEHHSGGMSMYVAGLFALLFSHDGPEKFFDSKHPFSQGNCKGDACKNVVRLVRELKPEVITVSGSLSAKSIPGKSNTVEAFVTTTSVIFSDGYHVPFVGYRGPITIHRVDTEATVQQRAAQLEEAIFNATP